ncbi:ATP-binding protein [Hydrogenimonas urashimensis]|uniref:ATP-binding protein n=1 Tax=Hydrogenimonas urashimensis TaxID=2740515 RepID=UPI001916B245|nr:ATP-binding protein [Hydrogenimonas urashimensis]
MSIDRNPDYLVSLLHELRSYPKETEWIEFKTNKAVAQDIGEYISALSNSAAVNGRSSAYMIWGIEDNSHQIVGTTFCPQETKVGNEELENWLLRLLEPKIDFRFHELNIDDKPIVILEITPAYRHPVRFKGEEYIRIGSYKKKLKDYPEKERKLWRILDAVPFEKQIAAEHINDDEVLSLLDYPAYFELLKLPLPENRLGILEALSSDDLIVENDGGGWNITNLGAILFAKKLESFQGLKRKAVRVIQYEGTGRIKTIREEVGHKGYASGFEGLIGFVNALLPTNEVIHQALRETVPMYPELAIRELIANALIHQDFFQAGTGPMIEIFSNRMEITNPGKPLVPTDRFLDSPPKSRNEALASFMRRIGVCEERGSGIDKVVFETEFYQLPAPLFQTTQEHTKAILFAHKKLKEMDKQDRVRACYLHACLRYVQHNYMTNTSLRERFGVESKNTAMISRIIKEALDEGVIYIYDESVGTKARKYIPWWARQ